MSELKIICREEGREPGDTETFADLSAAEKYIKERWQGPDYMDGIMSFHTDYCTYELIGFTLNDIGRIKIVVEDNYPYREYTFKSDMPPRHRIGVVRKREDGDILHYRMTPTEIDEAIELPDRDWSLLAHYSDEEYAARFGAPFVDDLDGILTPEEQDEYRSLCEAERFSDGQWCGRHAALSKKVWDARRPPRTGWSTDAAELEKAFSDGRPVMARQRGGVTWIHLQNSAFNHDVFEYWIGDDYPKPGEIPF